MEGALVSATALGVMTAGAMGAMLSWRADERAWLLSEARNLLQQLRTRLRRRLKRLATARVGRSAPPVATLAEASEMLDVINPDLVVCGARGLSSIKYAILGSISTFLTRNTECGTLVVK